MKRKPLIFAIALLFVVGAALRGVNYRLNHPPLTKTDKEFRASVAGADSVRISYVDTPRSSVKLPASREFALLDAKQSRAFIEQIRLVNNPPEASKFAEPTALRFVFSRHHKIQATFILFQASDVGILLDGKQISTPLEGYQINPRFQKSLGRYIDNKVLPRPAPSVPNSNSLKLKPNARFKSSHRFR